MRPSNPSEHEISLKCHMTANTAKIVFRHSIVSPSHQVKRKTAVLHLLVSLYLKLKIENRFRPQKL